MDLPNDNPAGSTGASSSEGELAHARDNVPPQSDPGSEKASQPCEIQANAPFAAAAAPTHAMGIGATGDKRPLHKIFEGAGRILPSSIVLGGKAMGTKRGPENPVRTTNGTTELDNNASPKDLP